MRAFNGRIARLATCLAALALGASCERTMVLTPRVESVEVGAVPALLALGERATLTAMARDASGDPLPDKPVYWKSEDTTVVHVDATGTVRARRPGAVMIVAGSEDKRREVEIVVPEGSRIAFNAIVIDTLSAADDADEFTFEGTVGQEISIVFLARSGSPADALRLRLLAPGRGEVVFVQSNGDYARAQGSGRVVLAQNGAYTVRVQGVEATDQGPYTFQVARVTRAPEVAAAAVSPNLEVKTETLAPPGDVDEFTYTVAAQQEVNVYFQSRTGARADSMMLRVLRPNLAAMDSVRSVGDDAGLEGRGIGYLALAPATYRR